MKRTIKLTLLACLILVISTLVFTACNSNNTNTNNTQETTQKETALEEATTPKETTSAPVPTHIWSEWIVIKEAKCEEKGLLQRYCTDCYYTESKPIDALGHTEVINESLAPTCIEGGNTEGKFCSSCGKTFIAQEIIDPLGHTIIIDKEIPPTCTQTGLTEGSYCSTCGEIFKVQKPISPVDFTVTANNREMIGYTGAEGENLVIPDVFESNGTWYRVTSIGKEAFAFCRNLTSITIPDSVTTIDEEAFYHCDNLTSVAIGASVTTIGYMAFESCDNLTSVVIPDSVTSIFPYAFDSCDNLTSVTIGNSVTTICYRAFFCCTNLTSVTIGDSVTTIGEEAFARCDNLTSVTIPNSVTTIDDGAFLWCDNLVSVTIGDSVTTIDEYAFKGCSKLVEVINKSSLDITAGSEDNGYVAYYANEVHNGTTKIVNQNDYFFYTYGGINYLIMYAGTDTKLILPETYNGQNYEINKYAFYYSTNLTSVTIGDSVTSIGYMAFDSCDNLTGVTISDSVTYIDRWAFCVKSITFEGTVAQWKAINKPSSWNSYTGNYTIYCTDGTASK